MAAGVRRQARWYALQVLYALDSPPSDDSDEVEADAGDTSEASEAVSSYQGAFDLELDERSKQFAAQLVEQTRSNLAAIDDAIQSASRNWRLERMSRVDRNILRLATSELVHSPDVPIKVVINEAVELAKRYGASEAPAFVNGILDRISQGVQRD